MKIRPVGAQLLHGDGQTDRQTERVTHDESKAGDTLSSRHVSSCDVTSAVGIFNIEFWRTHNSVNSAYVT
jgi:hypothetical protein